MIENYRTDLLKLTRGSVVDSKGLFWFWAHNLSLSVSKTAWDSYSGLGLAKTRKHPPFIALFFILIALTALV